MTFGEKLAEARKEKGLSQEELARQIFVTRQALSQMFFHKCFVLRGSILAHPDDLQLLRNEIMGLERSGQMGYASRRHLVDFVRRDHVGSQFA